MPTGASDCAEARRLLPLVANLLASNWDFLFHEERLPGAIEGRFAWSSMRRTNEAPVGLSEQGTEDWEDRWHSWWTRHCLLACRNGGLFPDLAVRRWRDTIEFSWGPARLAGAPAHYKFDSQIGFARLEPVEVASTLYEVLKDAAQHLLHEMSESPRFQRLVADIGAIQKVDRRRRIGLLAGLVDEHEAAFETLHSYFPKDLDADVEQAVFGTEEDTLVVQGSCHAALMFGTLAPNIDQPDAELLARKLVSLYSADGEDANLRQVAPDVPISESTDRPWKQGYDLAEEFHEVAGSQNVTKDWIDVQALCEHFGIVVETISLTDCKIRGVAIAGPKHRPAILINDKYEYTDEEVRRFTLAHELCHVLHDRSYGSRVAMASGPWAPVDLEKRANAFAAMLLMPTNLVETAVENLSEPIGQASAVWSVANRLHTSFSATLDHLQNLRFIDEATRDAIRNTTEQSSVANGKVSGT